jgi:hypothetical protein
MSANSLIYPGIRNSIERGDTVTERHAAKCDRQNPGNSAVRSSRHVVRQEARWDG